MLPYLYYQIVAELKQMGIDWIALVVAIGGIIGIYVKMEVTMKSIQVRQNAMEGSLDILRNMIQAQIDVDNDIKEVLSQLRVGQAKLDGKIDTIAAGFSKGR